MRIKAGKTYLDRCGLKHTMSKIEYPGNQFGYTHTDQNGLDYTSSGKYFNDRSDSDDDLVSEYVDPGEPTKKDTKTTTQPDPVNHPKHYVAHPSGIECITVTEHMGFNLGNAVKYIWRADLKGNASQDLEKAAWYINREIAKRNKVSANVGSTTSNTTKEQTK